MTLNKSAAAAVLLLAQWGVAQADCAREDLNTVVDDYLAALTSNDPSAVALASNLKSTENTRLVEAGEGIWQTAEEVVFARNVIDTESCGTVTMGLLQEDGRNIIYGVRLQVNDALEISEIEHVIAREDEFAFNPQGVLDTADVDWEVILDPEERASRMAMAAAANDYFDMFVGIPEVSVPFATPCDRWENGTRTTQGDCSPKGLTIVHGERRVPVIDRETGVAVIFIHFAQSLPDLHMFKFRNGQVELVQAVIGAAGPNMGWPDDPALSRRTPPPGEQMSAPMNIN